MARIDIPFVVEKQHISQPTREILVAGGQKYFYATFTVCDIWNEIYDIKAVFYNGSVSKLIPLIETDDGYECRIPWEVMVNKGVFHVGIFGGNRMLTDTDYIEVKQGCTTDGEAPVEPTPDWFSEMEKAVGNKVEKEDGKGLSSNDFTDEHAEQISTNATDIENLANDVSTNATDIGKLGNSKVDKLVPEDNANLVYIEAKTSGTMGIALANKATRNTVPKRGNYGELYVRDNPTLDNEAVSKAYVDNAINGALEDEY